MSQEKANTDQQASEAAKEYSHKPLTPEEMQRAVHAAKTGDWDTIRSLIESGFLSGAQWQLTNLAEKGVEGAEKACEAQLEPFTNWNEEWPHDQLKGFIKGAEWLFSRLSESKELKPITIEKHGHGWGHGVQLRIVFGFSEKQNGSNMRARLK